MIKKVFSKKKGTEFYYVDWNGQNLKEIQKFVGEEVPVEQYNYRTLIIDYRYDVDIGDCIVSDRFGYSFRIYKPEEFRRSFKCSKSSENV